MVCTRGDLWLPQPERKRLVRELGKYPEILKYDPDSGIQLKNKRYTDLYANFRAARNYPYLERRLGRLLKHALLDRNKKPSVDRIIDIPHAMSGIAAHAAYATGIPRATIRDKEKEHQDSVVVEVKPGETVAILEDVITDGMSKIPPYHLLLERGVRNVEIVVLVDRDGGWQENFEQHDVNVCVRPAMTLTWMRQFLQEIQHT